eukprot:5939966-Pyramimonas_sp.AAC.1
MGKESRVSKPVELRSWIGHGYHRRPHQIRTPAGSDPPWAQHLTNATTVAWPGFGPTCGHIGVSRRRKEAAARCRRFRHETA